VEGPAAERRAEADAAVTLLDAPDDLDDDARAAIREALGRLGG
jgi:hypothetical protein